MLFAWGLLFRPRDVDQLQVKATSALRLSAATKRLLAELPPPAAPAAPLPAPAAPAAGPAVDLEGLGGELLPFQVGQGVIDVSVQNAWWQNHRRYLIYETSTLFQKRNRRSTFKFASLEWKCATENQILQGVPKRGPNGMKPRQVEAVQYGLARNGRPSPERGLKMRWIFIHQLCFMSSSSILLTILLEVPLYHP